MTSLGQLATALLPCDYCHATRGDRCVTASGRRAGYTHSDRTELTRTVWLAGYRDGLTDALEWVRHARTAGHTVAQVEAHLAPWARALDDR